MSAKRKRLNVLSPVMLTGLAVFVVTVVAHAPASIASALIDHDRHRISYIELGGTIWKGNVRGAVISGAPLGDLSFSLSPWSLLRFAPAISVSAENGAITGEARIVAAPGGEMAIHDLFADINLASVAPRDVFGAPAYGAARVTAEEIRVSQSDGCIEANGEIWTNVLNAPARRYNLPPMPLTGDIECDNADILVSLSGANDRAQASLAIRIDRTLAYEIVATATAQEQELKSALRIFGFEDQNGALTYGSVGVLRGAQS